MPLPRSIRWRLQLWYGALLLALVAGFGFTAFHFEKARRFRRIDEELQARLSALVDALRANPSRSADRPPTPEVRFTGEQARLFGDVAGHYFVVWMQPEKPLTTSPNAPSQVSKPLAGDAFVRVRGEYREAFIFAAPVNCALVGRSVAAEEGELRTFAAGLAAVGSVILALGLVTGGWLVTRALRPVEAIGDTAAKIAAGDLSQRIATDDTESELGRLAGVLNSTFARLETAFAQQAQFTADAAHELRTPVAVMLTQTQSALARERPAEEYRETLEACQRATQRMRRLIESLLELARLDAGQEPLRRGPCDLAKIAAESIELLRPLATARGIQLHADLAPSPCEGDAERLAQVVVNLLSNAIEYNRDGGEVRVATGHASGQARLLVSNSGAGIAAEDLPHIFERFRRADQARTAGHAGLGLAICRAIVQAHGGTIEVAQTSAIGTTFQVTLPAAAQ